MRCCRTPLLLALLLAFSLTLTTTAQDDDFAEFEVDEQVVKVAEGANSHVVGNSEDMSEFEEEEEDALNEDSIEDMPIEEDSAFDFDDEEDDGEVESVEVDDNVDRDDFEDFADDQIIQTEPGEKFETIKKAPKTKKGGKGDIKFNKVPDHLRPSWKAFWVEGLLLSFIIYYIFNYFMGHKENENIAKALMSKYKPYLHEQFAQVGENNEGALTQQSHNNYTVWCTGRKGVEGMMVEINLVPRQDLITIWRNKFNRKRPQTLDTVTFSVYLDDSEPLEPIVVCLGKNRPIADLWMQFNDLRTFCPKGPKDKSAILKGNIGCAESMEMLTYLFDERNKAAMQDKEGASLHYMHITDNCQPKEADDATDEATEGEAKGKAAKLIVVSVEIDNDDDMYAENTLPFLKATVMILDKLRRMKLTKEVKTACEKRRTAAATELEKRKHTERHANAAARKEDDRRRLNRKIEEEEDPEKQRRLHNQLMKKDAKDRQKRMKGKQMKVK